MHRIAVVGHVEHVTLGRVESAPCAGDIAHLQDARIIAGGGGGLAFAQLAKSDAEVHFFTATGSDDAGALIRDRVSGTRGAVHVHSAVRGAPHPRVVVMIDANGKRTIIVTGEPLQPAATDPLPWAILSTCDAVYFTGSDPESLVLARAASCLVVTARRRSVLAAARVQPDVAIGSVADPRESSAREAYDRPPLALVLTDGERAIRIAREGGVTLVDPPARVHHPRGDYGAGDSFAAAFTYFMAAGRSVEEAVRLAGPFGAAVLGGIDPLQMQAALG